MISSSILPQEVDQAGSSKHRHVGIQTPVFDPETARQVGVKIPDPKIHCCWSLLYIYCSPSKFYNLIVGYVCHRLGSRESQPVCLPGTTMGKA